MANDNHEIKNNKLALLTSSEREWLYGRLKVSKAYEYRIKSDIKKKLHTFQQLELPLLEKRIHYFRCHRQRSECISSESEC